MLSICAHVFVSVPTVIKPCGNAAGVWVSLPIAIINTPTQAVKGVRVDLHYSSTSVPLLWGGRGYRIRRQLFLSHPLARNRRVTAGSSVCTVGVPSLGNEDRSSHTG